MKPFATIVLLLTLILTGCAIPPPADPLESWSTCALVGMALALDELNYGVQGELPVECQVEYQF